MHRSAVFAGLVGVLAGCGATDGGAEGASNSVSSGGPSTTEGPGSPATATSTNVGTSSTAGGSNGGTGGAKAIASTVVTTSSGGIGTANASSGTGGDGPVVCGDVACGPPLRATVVPPVGLAQLSEADIHICVDEWCASGTFPAFSLDGVSGYVGDASFVTDTIDEASGRRGYFVEAYTDYDRLVISHESVVGERFSVEFSKAGAILGRESGTLKVETTESVCLSCTTYTFLNLPE